MEPEAAPLIDRILHARAEVLLRRVVREQLGRVARCEHAPLVVVGHDRSRHERWVARGDAELPAAVAAELDPVAAGCLVEVRAVGRGVVGTAVTVSAVGARAFALDAVPRRLGRVRVHLGPQEDPTGRAAPVALALLDAIERARRVRGWS